MTSEDYWPAKFDVTSIDEAKRIILTVEGGLSADERWALETRPVVELLRDQFDITEHSVLLDFGAGVGRVARELIEQTGCYIVGVDISASMRTLGHIYCNSPNYLSCSVEGLKSLFKNGFRADFSYSIWVLQHSDDPSSDVSLLFDSLSDDGGLYVLKFTYRALPVHDGWNFDLRPLIEEKSKRFTYPPPPDGLILDSIKETTFSGIYWK